MSIAKLSFNHPETSKSQLLVHITKPKENLGQILIIAEIEKAKSESIAIIKKLISEMQSIYFSENTQSLEKALENSLQKINIIISEIVKKETDIWLQNLNMVIIVYKNAEVHFSKIGKIKVFLANEKSITDVAEESKEKEKINIIKSFANIFSGQINKGEGIIFLNENILDYISQDKIRRLIVNSQNSREALKELENLLKKAPKSKSFASILITEKPNVVSGKKQETKIHKDTFTYKAENNKKEIKEMKEEKNKSKTIERNYLSRMRNKSNQSQLIEKFKQMPILSKISIVLFIIIIVLLINTFKKQKPTNITLPQDNTFEISLAKIKAAQIEANSAFIIEDLTAAKNKLNQAKELLDILPEDTQERKIIKQELAIEINKNWLKTLGIKNIENPSWLADFRQIEKEIKAAEIFKKDDNLYTYNLNEFFSLLKHNLKNQKTEKIPITATVAPKIAKFIGSLEKKLIFYSQEGKSLAALNLEDNKISTLTWAKTEALKNPANFTIYQDKLYILDSDVGQIFKYQKTTSGFATETKWLTAEIDLSQALSMAIDGNIWVLNKNGEILKLFKGKQETFSYALEPILDAPTKIYTNADALYLYILDPASRRIIILSKTGVVISQFTSDSFDDLRDIVIDENAKKIYVLNGEKVYELGF